jgi:hypothetical protein
VALADPRQLEREPVHRRLVDLQARRHAAAAAAGAAAGRGDDEAGLQGVEGREEGLEVAREGVEVDALLGRAHRAEGARLRGGFLEERRRVGVGGRVRVGWGRGARGVGADTEHWHSPKEASRRRPLSA